MNPKFKVGDYIIWNNRNRGRVVSQPENPDYLWVLIEYGFGNIEISSHIMDLKFDYRSSPLYKALTKDSND